jgi:eukaryotic-like serine/threonine-protein kinase
VLGVKALNAKADPRNNAQPTANPSAGPVNPRPITLSAGQVRIVDPKGDRKETENAARVVDGDPDTAWKTNGYTRANFGGSKPGMGILINLGEIRHVASVKVQLTLPGAKAQLRTGIADPGNSREGDATIDETYTAIGDVKIIGKATVFAVDQKAQFLLIWFTELPLENANSANPYKIGVEEISVEVQ